LIFFAGASGIMTGHYLTTEGRQLGNDLELLADLNFYPR
jgi:biotin synthase